MTAPAPPVCPRHPDRPSYINCQRCGRPVCPECQRPAAVGIQCVDCVREQARTVRTPTSRFGAPTTGGRPIVTLTLIAICAVVYVGQLTNDRVTFELMFVPLLAESEPWRFITAAFAHSPSGVMHILFNMFALWITGQYLEPLLGRVKFLALFLISAIGGSVGYLLLAPFPDGWTTPTVGASGAVFGLFAATLVLNRHLGRETGGIIVVFVINGVLGFVLPNIAWQAHLGGAVTGAIIALVLAATAPTGRTVTEAASRRRWFWPAMLGLLVVLAATSYWRIQSVADAILM
ncbi:rhomboid family intramembrane serine protease [Ornithinimicrobium sp. F0845]|uniref:rhomboid family intramembrane serine protease n=1 Tax=Ornithinimicrobium sp. F0845 TaxID=2926412 RepID=UPI001FF5A88E|nr:rhomboid family intramembrane serine protease [Ornithinimicrobium sp. F0845]MCK0113439.1 rhomboid family intramembrane serine protease [Ornithinimicrobium sp. F0845]